MARIYEEHGEVAVEVAGRRQCMTYAQAYELRLQLENTMLSIRAARLQLYARTVEGTPGLRYFHPCGHGESKGLVECATGKELEQAKRELVTMAAYMGLEYEPKTKGGYSRAHRTHRQEFTIRMRLEQYR